MGKKRKLSSFLLLVVFGESKKMPTTDEHR
jgi:hypothetical protein